MAWPGEWVELADDAVPSPSGDLTAFGRLHYVPTDHRGLRKRMGAISSWISAVAPRVLVADVSVEVALLARLHGVPVVSMGMPGHRGDAAHRLGYDVSDLVVGPWPAEATPFLHPGGARERLVEVGAISRYAPQQQRAEVVARSVLVLNGTGGSQAGALTPGTLTAGVVAAAEAVSPGWSWSYLAGATHWVDDPWPQLCAAEVVVSHCGQNAVAEIAAARRPAVLVPGDRPFGEQHATAEALRALGLPAIVLDRWPAADRWPDLLERAAELDGADWARWNDGRGAGRAADLLLDLSGTRSGDPSCGRLGVGAQQPGEQTA
ncbi:MAG: glycosyltransferase [Propionibacteriaceae bacterium]